jgi:hypothetical protein
MLYAEGLLTQRLQIDEKKAVRWSGLFSRHPMNLKNYYARLHRLIILPILFLLLAPATYPQSSASVAQANLNYLVENAQTIVRGNVLSSVLEPHPQFANLQTVVVTIAVAKTFKGQAAATITFRQYVWNVRDVTGAGGYHKSEELLLFLNPTSLYGLTSPVGMEQGRFRVLHDRNGNRYAVNGRGNVGLFADAITASAARGLTLSPQAKAMLSKSGGQASLDTLEETIQALVAVRR